MKLPLTLFSIALFLNSCTSPSIETGATRQPSADNDKPHTQTSFKNLDELKTYSNQFPEIQVKFILLDYQSGADGQALFLDPAFYAFHDDWFLFELFNGRSVPGFAQAPFADWKIESPQAVQLRLRATSPLPQGLINESGRVIAKDFYTAAAGKTRVVGLGSVIFSYNAKRQPTDVLAFDMVFNDQPSEADLEIFTSRLKKAINLPSIKWLPRSPSQEALALKLKGTEKWKGQFASYEDFMVPGQITIYSGGATAGHLKYFPRGQYQPTLVKPDDILLLDELPDDVPPVRGILTSVPQTELAHINLLSRGRGTLNVAVGDRGLFETLKGKVSESQVIGIAAIKSNESELIYNDLTQEEYSKFLSFSEKNASALPPVAWKDYAYIYPLETLNPKWKDSDIVRTLGGKNLGMTKLIKAKVARPPGPFGISVRAYREHLERQGLLAKIQATLKNPKFINDEKVQFLVLEGPKKFKKRFPGDKLADTLKNEKSALGELVRMDGIKEAIEKQPLDPEVNSAVLKRVTTSFGTFPKGQAMRFRSSSDLEDIPGFVGAGLYDSYKGYVDPANQAEDDDDRNKTFEHAIKKTWASYWNYRAFKERELAKLDHLSGSMAIMAHPNFPEKVERANGVITVELEKGFEDIQTRVSINTNYGDEPVVRPDGSLNIPQQIEMSSYAMLGGNPNSGDFYVSKFKASSPKGVQVLSEAEAKQLAIIARQIVNSWMDDINKSLPDLWKNKYYKLDIEFKKIPDGWLNNKFSDTGSEVFIMKQARPLIKFNERNMKFADLPIPRSLLSEATRMIKRTSHTDFVEFETVEVYKEDTPYDGAFNAYMQLKWTKDTKPFKAKETTKLFHTDYRSNHGFMHHGPWNLSVNTNEKVAKQTKLAAFEMYEQGGLSVDPINGGERISGQASPVKTEEMLENAGDWLQKKLLEKAPKKSNPCDGPRIGIGITPMMTIGIGNPCAGRIGIH